MRPTKAGIGLALASILSIFLGRMFGILEFYLLAAMCITALVLSLIAALAKRPNISVARTPSPQKIRVGQEAKITLSISNASTKTSTPIFSAQDNIAGESTAKVLVPPIAKQATTSVSYPLHSTTRGVTNVGPLTLAVQDPLGLYKSNSTAAGVQEIIIRPRLLPLRPLDASSGSMKQTHTMTQTSKGNGDEFYALKPYVIGDDIRKVNWKAAARTGELMVRQDEDVKLGIVTIVLDTSLAVYDSESFERAVVAANSVVHSAYAGKDTTWFTTTSAHHPIEIADASALDGFERNLALVQPNENANLITSLQTLLRNRFGGTLIFITGNPSQEIAKTVSLCRSRYKKVIPITSRPSSDATWALSYTTDQEFRSLWEKTLAVRS